jgi:hypothetical protein
MLKRLSLAFIATTVLGLSSTPDPALGQGTVEYTVVFDSSWSAETHPQDFPSNPHFSGLIGGTHHSGVAFWELGQPASEGMERMAEQGSKTALEAEVNDAIAAGTAEFVLSGGGINRSPGSVDLTFQVSEDHSLVTLVSMLAPSPDWWVGVGSLDLHPGSEWIDELVVDLVVYDSGTDSGTEYTSSNMNTDPAEPISIKTDGPFAANNVVGTFTFSRQVSSTPDLATDSPRFLLPLSANPLRDVARFAISPQLRAQADIGSIELAVFDTRGARVRSLASGLDLRTSSVAEWDGRNGRGVAVAAGTYFLTLRATGIKQTEKIVVIR